jgi:glucose 1-dehydrogenase
MRLQNRVALVTGSSRGIGRAMAVRFGREGAAVVVNCRRDAEGAKETCAQIEATGGRAYIIQADVGSVGEAQGMIAAAIEHFGKLDILVNNAGILKNAALWEVTEEDYDRVLDVDLKGPFFTIQAFVRHLMETNRPGKVINISSVHEELPFPQFASYCIAKGGLRMLTRALAIELGRFDITVNAIAPGAIQTTANTGPPRASQRHERLSQQIPLGRLGRPEEVAAIAAFLASSEADYITGSTYSIDGGLTWHYEE